MWYTGREITQSRFRFNDVYLARAVMLHLPSLAPTHCLPADCPPAPSEPVVLTWGGGLLRDTTYGEGGGTKREGGGT